MPISRLKGLKGLSSLSSEERQSFMAANDAKLSGYRNPRQREKAANVLYMNQRFINTFGREAFDKANDGTEESFNRRNQLLRDKVVRDEFTQKYNPIIKRKDGSHIRDNSRGLGADWEKYYTQLSTDAKEQLLNSDFKTNRQLNNEHKQDTSTWYGKAIDFVAGEAIQQYKKDSNAKILNNIFNEDTDKEAKRLSSQVSSEYFNPSIANMSDSQVKKAFIQAITPGSYRNANGMPNMGISEYASHYGNGTDVSSEMEDFSIDDMRQVLAKKATYEKYMSPDRAATALNNDAKRYIKEHQGTAKRMGLFLKDVGISALSYSADKVNGIYNLGLMVEDKWSNAPKPIVMVDDAGNILDPKKAKVTKDRLGRMVYLGNDGKTHFVHREQMDRTTLHNMGKNFDGSEDTSLLNQQYWTRAEQFGTLDENEQKQYEKLGSSPYKVAYNPNEDTDLWYEAFKMSSFGLADAASMLIPFGIGVAGRALSTASKLGKVAKGLGKGMDVAGKVLTNKYLQGTAGALGIANAYQRGAFQETLAKNLATVDETVLNASRNDVVGRYRNDKEYKANVDKLINAEVARQKAAFIAQSQKEGGMQIADEKAFDKVLRSKATEAVLTNLTNQRVSERKASKNYADLQEKAIKEAGDAATNTFLPEAIKYGFVNTIGFRKFLYTNPAGLMKKAAPAIKGLKEITTEGGKQRLAATSKFLTSKGKLKEFGKTLGSQMWGGAWTNGTDDMQVDAAERMSDDSFNRYVHQYQNGEALADTYGFADGFYSYLKGLQNSMGQETTWNAAVVGGLGSVVNFTPNFANIAHLASKEGRDAYKKTFQQEYDRNAEGILKYQKNDDGSYKKDELGRLIPVTKEVGLADNWRERVNFFLQNGVLNTYYGKKVSERELQNHADYVNELLENNDDFRYITDLVAADRSLDHINGISDEKTAKFIKAFNTITSLEGLGKNKKDPVAMSSVIQNAKTLIERASKLDTDENDFEEDEIKNLLSQYCAHNPGMEQSDENNQVALQAIADNAKSLQKAYDLYSKADDQVEKIAKNNGTFIHPMVADRLKMQWALINHWKDRKKTMQDEIGDVNNTSELSEEDLIPSYGSKAHAQKLIKVYDKQIDEYKEEVEKVQKQREELQKKYDDAQKTYDEVSKEDDSDATSSAYQALVTAHNNMENLKQNEKFFNDMITLSEDKRDKLSSALTALGGEKAKVLTADEIFALDPVSRARMLNPMNREFYSKNQQREIERLEQKLNTEDADKLQKIQDIALLTHRINTSEDAYNRMSMNPSAAEVELNKQNLQAADTAYKLIEGRNAGNIADFIGYINSDLHSSQAEKNSVAFNILKQFKASTIGMIDDRNLLPKYKKQIDDAKEFVKLTDDIDAVISESDREEEWKDNIRKSVDVVVKTSTDRDSLMTNLEKVISTNEGTQSATDFDYILKGLERLGYQRDATIIESRKQKKEREEAAKKQQEEEAKRIEEEAKSAARKSAETKKEINSSNTEIVGEEEIQEGKQSTSNVETNKTKSLENYAEYNGQVWVVGDTGTDGKYTYTIRNISGKGQNAQVTVTREKDGKSTELPMDLETLAKVSGIKPSKTLQDVQSTTPESRVQNNSIENNNNNSEKSTTFAEDKSKNAEEVNTEKAPINNGIVVDDTTVKCKSETIEEIAADAVSEGIKVEVSDVNTDVDTINALGEHGNETNATTISGTAMLECVLVNRVKVGNEVKPADKEGNPVSSVEDAYKPLSEEGVLLKRKGSEENDSMNKYFAWMNDNGIHLDNIINHELAEILRGNPHLKIKFMGVCQPSSADIKQGLAPAIDKDMFNYLMLVVDYDDSINSGITSIHNPKNGGVIESNGKKYLIVGTAGYGNGNRNPERRVLYDRIWSHVDGYKHFNLKVRSQKFYQESKAKHIENPSIPVERFYVDEELSTEIVPNSLIPGYIIKQGYQDTVPGVERTLGELLADEERNPIGLDWKSIASGIQKGDTFLTVRESRDNVMVPREREEVNGKVFILIPAGNGKYVPSYVRKITFGEMRDGALKEEVNNLLYTIIGNDKSFKDRYDALVELRKILYLDDLAGNLWLENDNSKITIITNHGDRIPFMLDNNFDSSEFIDTFSRSVNPLVNITPTVLSSDVLLKKYDEAGAFVMDVASLSTAGSSYSIYGLDKEGKMIIPETPVNDVTTSYNTSDYKTDSSQVIFNQKYYVKNGDTYYQNAVPVTDPNVIKQLEYNRQVVANKLHPVESDVNYDRYILDGGEHPVVIAINRFTKEVTEATEEQAKALINKIEERKSMQQRDKAAAEQVDLENKEAKQLDDMSQTDVSDGMEFTTDSESGLINPSEEEVKVSKEKEEEESSVEKKEITNEETTQNSVESLGSKEHKNSTQTFKSMINSNSSIKKRIWKIVRSKWKDAPKDINKLSDFLKNKGININNIGNSEEDIETWIRTLEECK